jgi:hypothetical protein
MTTTGPFWELTKYFNSKVKPVIFKEDKWVLMKKHNLIHRNKPKNAETFRDLLVL